ncbi:unnamed protein product [Amoebophrya sp. A25]|nr:unnamed protein product [Amoebophrya sp. A25]|eukprot:GSA25T00019948001.1
MTPQPTLTMGGPLSSLRRLVPAPGPSRSRHLVAFPSASARCDLRQFAASYRRRTGRGNTARSVDNYGFRLLRRYFSSTTSSTSSGRAGKRKDNGSNKTKRTPRSFGSTLEQDVSAVEAGGAGCRSANAKDHIRLPLKDPQHHPWLPFRKRSRAQTQTGERQSDGSEESMPAVRRTLDEMRSRLEAQIEEQFGSELNHIRRFVHVFQEKLKDDASAAADPDGRADIESHRPRGRLGDKGGSLSSASATESCTSSSSVIKNAIHEVVSKNQSRIQVLEGDERDPMGFFSLLNLAVLASAERHASRLRAIQREEGGYEDADVVRRKRGSVEGSSCGSLSSIEHSTFVVRDLGFLENAARYMRCAHLAYADHVNDSDEYREPAFDRILFRQSGGFKKRHLAVAGNGRGASEPTSSRARKTVAASAETNARKSKDVDIGGPEIVVGTDDTRRAVVVSVRGTASVDDVAALLMIGTRTLRLPRFPLEQTKKRDKKGTDDLVLTFHEGIFASAIYTLDQTFEVLRNILHEKNERSGQEYDRVIFCGHSFGGGVAQVAALLFRHLLLAEQIHLTNRMRTSQTKMKQTKMMFSKMKMRRPRATTKARVAVQHVTTKKAPSSANMHVELQKLHVEAWSYAGPPVVRRPLQEELATAETLSQAFESITDPRLAALVQHAEAVGSFTQGHHNINYHVDHGTSSKSINMSTNINKDDLLLDFSKMLSLPSSSSTPSSSTSNTTIDSANGNSTTTSSNPNPLFLEPLVTLEAYPFVMEHDLVPSLSVGSLMRLLISLREIDRLGWSPLQKLQYIVQAELADPSPMPSFAGGAGSGSDPRSRSTFVSSSSVASSGSSTARRSSSSSFTNQSEPARETYLSKLLAAATDAAQAWERWEALPKNWQSSRTGKQKLQEEDTGDTTSLLGVEGTTGRRQDEDDNITTSISASHSANKSNKSMSNKQPRTTSSAANTSTTTSTREDDGIHGSSFARSLLTRTLSSSVASSLLDRVQTKSVSSPAKAKALQFLSEDPWDPEDALGSTTSRLTQEALAPTIRADCMQHVAYTSILNGGPALFRETHTAEMQDIKHKGNRMMLTGKVEVDDHEVDHHLTYLEISPQDGGRVTAHRLLKEVDAESTFTTCPSRNVLGWRTIPVGADATSALQEVTRAHVDDHRAAAYENALQEIVKRRRVSAAQERLDVRGRDVAEEGSE